jgi:hypothetical protein
VADPVTRRLDWDAEGRRRRAREHGSERAESEFGQDPMHTKAGRDLARRMRAEIGGVTASFALLDESARLDQLDRWRQRISTIHDSENRKLSPQERLDLGPILQREWKTGLDQLTSLVPKTTSRSIAAQRQRPRGARPLTLDVRATWAAGLVSVDWTDMSECESWTVRIASTSGGWDTTLEVESGKLAAVLSVPRKRLPAKVFVMARMRGKNHKKVTLGIGSANVVRSSRG